MNMKMPKMDAKIKPYKMPKMLKQPKDEDLSIAIKLPVDRKSAIPWVKFNKV